MISVKVKKINPDAKLPVCSNPGDAGMDLFSVIDLIIDPGEVSLIPTGLILELPTNTEAQVRPRSGLALNNGITVLNSPGTIDEGYRGEIGVILINHGKVAFRVEKHMKIAQLVIKPIFDVELVETCELTDSVRGSSGFGSSGR